MWFIVALLLCLIVASVLSSGFVFVPASGVYKLSIRSLGSLGVGLDSDASGSDSDDDYVPVAAKEE